MANLPAMSCRPGCGACCIAPSISSLNKPAGVPCVHLDTDFRCTIFGRPERPACCAGLQAAPVELRSPREEEFRSSIRAIEGQTRAVEDAVREVLSLSAGG